LLLRRAFEFTVCGFEDFQVALALLIELGIVNRYSCLTCKGGEELNLFCNELVCLSRVKGKDPKDLALGD
jgi:hypothetical protein